MLKMLADEQRTMVFYESPFRLIKALEQFIEFFGPSRRASVSRELTKKFEEFLRGTAGEILAQIANRAIKGEFVVLMEAGE